MKRIYEVVILNIQNKMFNHNRSDWVTPAIVRLLQTVFQQVGLDIMYSN